LKLRLFQKILITEVMDSLPLAILCEYPSMWHGSREHRKKGCSLAAYERQTLNLVFNCHMKNLNSNLVDMAISNHVAGLAVLDACQLGPQRAFTLERKQ
jgi:hypothetical protein